MEEKLSYRKGSGHPALMNKTISAAFEECCTSFPDNAALIIPHQSVEWSYTKLRQEVLATAKGLHALGLQKGDRIGILSPSRVEWPVVQYATAYLGLILVNLNPAYQAEELEFALSKSGCRALVMADTVRTFEYYDILNKIDPAIAQSTSDHLRVEKLPKLEFVIKMGDAPKPGCVLYDGLAARGAKIADTTILDIARGLDANEAINIQFTSGTTGHPKGATLSHQGLLNDGMLVGYRMGVGSSDTLCVPLPLFHVLGMMGGNMVAMLNGAAVMYPGELFDPKLALEGISTYGCTYLYGVPTMFIAILNDPDFATFDVSSLRSGVIAGAPAPDDLMRKMISDLNMEGAVNAYGMTETSGGSMTTVPEDDIERRVQTIGRALPNVEVKLTDADGNIVPIGATGEIKVRGFLTMLGYWGEDEKTAETIDADGWLASGDLATMDEDGYCRFVGRSKDIIIRGGENISPVEIETFLHRHPAIESVYIVGTPHERLGEEICAFVKKKPGENLSPDDIVSFCKGQISHFKIPKHIFFADSFPTTGSGKVQKFKLAEQATKMLQDGVENA